MGGCLDAKTGSRSCVYKALSTARRTLGHGGERGGREPNHGCTDLPAVGISLAPTHTANKGLPPHPQCPFLVRSPPLHSGTPPHPPARPASSWLLSPKPPHDSELTPQPAPRGPLTDLGPPLPTLLPYSGQPPGRLGRQGGFTEAGTSPQLLSHMPRAGAARPERPPQ